MPPSEQEQRCAELVCEHLGQTLDGQWEPSKWLDDESPSMRSPDVLLSDGTSTMALEIKQLTDGEEFQSYSDAHRSLSGSLTPPTGGRFYLIPPLGTHLPLDRELAQRLRPRVAAAAEELVIGGSAPIPVERKAELRHVGEGDGFITCEHLGTEVRSLSAVVPGNFYLVDGGGPSHKFVTEGRRRAFRRAIHRACEASMRDGTAELEWCEEWELRRVEDSSDGRSGVSVIAVASDDPLAAAVEAVSKAVDATKPKFKQQWAERAALALHAGQIGGFLTMDDFENALGALDAAAVRPIDVIFLVGDGDIREFP